MFTVYTQQFPVELSSCALSNDGQRVACGLTNGQTILLPEGKTYQTLGLISSTAVRACAFNSDGSILGTIANSNEATLYNLQNPQPMCSISVMSHIPRMLYFSADNKSLMLGHSDGYLTMWNISAISSAQLKNEWSAQQTTVDTCALARSEKFIASISKAADKNTLNIQGIGGRCIGTYSVKTQILACTFSFDENDILLAHDTTLSILNRNSGQIISSYTYPADIFNLRFVVFSPDGKHVLFVNQMPGLFQYNFKIISIASLLLNFRPNAVPATSSQQDTEETLLLGENQHRHVRGCCCWRCSCSIL